MKQALKSFARGVGVNRQNVAAARMCCERHWLATFGRPSKRYVGRILCYHSVGQSDWGVNDISPAHFRRHIEMALNAGFKFAPASEVASGRADAKTLAITFDDGLKSVLTNAAPILKDYNLPWSFFPVSDWSDLRYDWCNNVFLTWKDIEQLLAQGAELGSHSETHPDFSKIEAQQIVDELGNSRDLIEKRLGFAPKTFAIPFGQSGNWPKLAADAARAAGYDLIYAQAEETRPEGTIARTFVTKFDGDRIFNALLAGKYDRWEEWI
ncbi:MAG: polysaccharide deacetylase family protein [Terricaulis sp.]